MINQNDIQQLRQISILDVIGSRIGVKRKGNKYWACCPFHNERTPSFVVNPEKNTYCCYGCHKTGNTISFIQEYDKLGFIDACRQLAKDFNISLQEQSQAPSKDSIYYEILATYQDFYKQTKGEYMTTQRGFSQSTLDTFGVGYTSSQKNQHLLSLSLTYETNDLITAGQVGIHNEKPYDVFREGVIFPIHNFSGKIVGFGRRDLSGKSKAKYLNTQKTPIYDKSYNLYGIYQAKKAIREKDFCFLVEGYTDVLRLHEVGYANVVAACGTALTKEQVRLIRRFTSTVVLLYDGDTAGLKAAHNNMQVLFEQGLYVKIILLPEGKDPDDYFRENPKDIDRLLLESKDAISHYIFEAKNSTEKRGEIIHKIKELLAMIPDNLIRKMYFDELDEKLGQYKGVLAEEIDKMPNNRVIQQQKHSKLFYLEARLLYFLIKNGKLPIHGKEGNATVFGYIKQELQDVFELGYCEELVEIINLIGATTNPNSEYIAANTNNATILEMLSFLYAEAKHNKENTDVLQVESTHIFEYVYKYILQLKFELMNKLIEENAKLLNGENDELVLNTHNAYVQYKHQIQKQINETKLPIQ